MRTIAVVNLKGGQLKTTTVVNVAACLAGQGRRVLVVDADTQANATHVLLRGAAPRRPTLSEVLAGEAAAGDAVVPSGVAGVSLLPSEPGLADVNAALSSEVGRERRLRAAMAGLGAAGAFDVCLVDTGPTRSLVLTNVLNFAREVVVPIAPGVFGLLGLNQLLADVGLVRRFLENRELAVTGVFLALAERNNVCREFERRVRETYGGLVLKAAVPRSVKFEEANARALTIFEHAPGGPGARAYEALTAEVMSRGRTEEERDDAPRDTGNGPGNGRRRRARDLPADHAA